MTNQNGEYMTIETTIDTGTGELLCVLRDRVAIITLNRPEVRNALSDHLTPALRAMIKTCGENPEVGALLITGADRNTGKDFRRVSGARTRRCDRTNGPSSVHWLPGRRGRKDQVAA